MEAQTAYGSEVLATFRVVGDSLDPEVITACMALKPTTAHVKGESVPKHPDRKYPIGYWGLDSALESRRPLDDHLKHLLDIIESRQATLEEIKQRGWSVSFYCAYFAQTAFDNTVHLEPQTLGRVATLGVRLELHIYCDEDTAE